MNDARGNGGVAAVFVLPATTAGQQGPLASFVSTAGWASAARRVVGEAWIVTPSGVVDPADARRLGSARQLSPAGARRIRVPAWAKTAIKDVRAWRRNRAFRVQPDGPWSNRSISFVWQRHELFQRAGFDLAHELGAPLVLFVPATLVWEARQWGVTRPGWGSLVERLGETRQLRAADIVACGSEAVATQVRRLGVPDGRVLITPSGVDLDLFARSADERDATRDRLGLDGVVVGWVGSFRPFHALDQALDAVAAVGDVTLLLVGDGPERPALERRVERLGLRVVFTGTVEHDHIPVVISAMDVALVLARADEEFHYSPLKLAEYLAAGVAVVVPDVPQLRERLTDGVHAVFVPPGKGPALTDAIAGLAGDVERRRAVGAAGRRAAEAQWSWDDQVRRVVASLGARRVGH